MNVNNPSICADTRKQFDTNELALEKSESDKTTYMKEHFQSCDSCKQWLSDWELLKVNVRNSPQLDVPADFLSGVMAGLESRSAPSKLDSDLLLCLGGLVAMFLVSLSMGVSEGAPGNLSWCGSLLLLLMVHYFVQGRNKFRLGFKHDS